MNAHRDGALKHQHQQMQRKFLVKLELLAAEKRKTQMM